MNAAPRERLHTTIGLASCRLARHELLHPRPSSASHRTKQFTALWPWVRSMLSYTPVFLMEHRTLLSLGIDPAPLFHKVEHFTAIWPWVIPMGFLCRGRSSQFGRAAHPNLVVVAHTPSLDLHRAVGALKPSSSSHRNVQFTALWPWVLSMLSSTPLFLVH